MIMVDNGDNLDGKFGYKSLYGEIEYVEVLDKEGVKICDTNGSAMSVIYTEDIPKMIKALQAAYEYSKK